MGIHRRLKKRRAIAAPWPSPEELKKLCSGLVVSVKELNRARDEARVLLAKISGLTLGESRCLSVDEMMQYFDLWIDKHKKEEV